ncbi:MAG: hypothetical protein EXQ77_04560 [Thermoleophilia bacterium]|nr:hypothetical protein [Thermoleophilia bacterium]
MRRKRTQRHPSAARWFGVFVTLVAALALAASTCATAAQAPYDASGKSAAPAVLDDGDGSDADGSADDDGDGITDTRDTDDDNDGVPDTAE